MQCWYCSGDHPFWEHEGHQPGEIPPRLAEWRKKNPINVPINTPRTPIHETKVGTKVGTELSLGQNSGTEVGAVASNIGRPPIVGSPWKEEGISRTEWYRRQKADQK